MISEVAMASYYRQTTVYTSFATTALGLLAMGVIAVMDCMEKRRKGRKVSTHAVIPPGVGHVQNSFNGKACDSHMYIIRFLESYRYHSTSAALCTSSLMNEIQ